MEPVRVLRSLPVLAMSAVLPWSEELWRDISRILGARVQDTPDVLRCYRRALRRGDQETLLAVDARVCADPEWGGWARALPDLQEAALREFSDTNRRVGAPGEASLKGEHRAEVLEFLRLIAHVLRRIPRP